MAPAAATAAALHFQGVEAQVAAFASITALSREEEEETAEEDSLLGDAPVEPLLGLPLPLLPLLLEVVVPSLGLPLPPAVLDPEEEEEELDPVDEEEEGAGEDDKG